MGGERLGFVESAPKPDAAATPAPAEGAKSAPEPAPKEIGGRAGLEPTRYGDWEVKGIASDF